ncbi:hypothetical protein Tco_0970536 [Tanacetum coccineum]
MSALRRIKCKRLNLNACRKDFKHSDLQEQELEENQRKVSIIEWKSEYLTTRPQFDETKDLEEREDILDERRSRCCCHECMDVVIVEILKKTVLWLVGIDLNLSRSRCRVGPDGDEYGCLRLGFS